MYFIKNFTNGLVLFKGIFIGSINYNQKQISKRGFFKGRFEGINKMMWKVAYKSNGIGNKNSCAVIKRHLACKWIQSSKELVFYVGLCSGKSIQKA